jgi:molybdopterin-containing oxidoreductase family membrane subunit
VPQFLWSYKVRTNPILVFIICQFISVGMWLERFVIVVISLQRDFLDSSWDMYAGTKWDWLMYIGTMGLFLTFVFTFIRTLPILAIFEMRELVHKTEEHHDDSH